MTNDIKLYIEKLNIIDQEICELLTNTIDSELTNSESKIWHAHPVWFLDGNPIVGYSKQKKGIRLMFWSGVDFEDDQLNVIGGKFKDASIFINSTDEIDKCDLKRWLKKSIEIQWDYKNIVKRKGQLKKINFNYEKT